MLKQQLPIIIIASVMVLCLYSVDKSENGRIIVNPALFNEIKGFADKTEREVRSFIQEHI